MVSRANARSRERAPLYDTVADIETSAITLKEVEAAALTEQKRGKASGIDAISQLNSGRL